MKSLPLLLISAAFALNACTNNPITYYRLPNSTFQLPAAASDSVAIKVVLADSLNQGNLLYQPSPNTIHFAQQHLWADDLDNEIANTLANNLNQLNNEYSFNPSLKTNKALIIHINNFQGSYDGHVHISGYTEWQGIPRQNRNFNIHTVQQGNGYSNMVNALAYGLKQIAQQIAP